MKEVANKEVKHVLEGDFIDTKKDLRRLVEASQALEILG